MGGTSDVNVALVLKSGNRFYTTGVSISEVKTRVEMGSEIECWWYSVEGKKSEETFIFPDDGDAISHYMTDVDVSPLEEL